MTAQAPLKWSTKARATTLAVTLKAVKGFISKNGYSPTVREVMAATATSSTSVVAHRLRRLRTLGYIAYEDGKSRTIRVLEVRE